MLYVEETVDRIRKRYRDGRLRLLTSADTYADQKADGTGWVQIVEWYDAQLPRHISGVRGRAEIVKRSSASR